MISAPHISSVILSPAVFVKVRDERASWFRWLTLLARLALLADLGKRIWQHSFHIDQTGRGKMTVVGPRLVASRCHPIS